MWCQWIWQEGRMGLSQCVTALMGLGRRLGMWRWVTNKQRKTGPDTHHDCSHDREGWKWHFPGNKR